MKSVRLLSFLLCILMCATSCVSKKKLLSVQSELDLANTDLAKCGKSLGEFKRQLSSCEQDKSKLEIELKNSKELLSVREEQIEDLIVQREQQMSQVGELTVLTQSANDNIKETLGQLEKTTEYVRLLQGAKTKADSMNLALAVNLKGELQDGIMDQDVDIKVDKTVVFINLSDKMLYKSGSFELTPQANVVLGKIAKIIQSRPELEVMVEGYTDNVPIKNSCMRDNWDLSVKRAVSVVQSLQKNFMIDPNRLIAAGRGEYNVLASNGTFEGRQMNRRTRIIILPKLNEFYDLLDPEKVPK